MIDFFRLEPTEYYAPVQRVQQTQYGWCDDCHISDTSLEKRTYGEQQVIQFFYGGWWLADFAVLLNWPLLMSQWVW